MYNYLTHPIDKPHPKQELKGILIALFNTNMSAHYPFAMELLMSLEKEAITIQECHQLLREVYILIVRRKIANLRTTKFDTFFPPLAKSIINEPDKIKAFQSNVQKDGLWVSDQEFAQSFVSKELYNSRELNFTRHVLQEIDKKLQKFGEYPDYTSISSIEHIIPQTLDEHWKGYLGKDSYDLELPKLINTIGNLCLNSPSANSSKGQKSFNDKVSMYNDISALAKDIKQRNEPWNLDAVKKRSLEMADIALDIWNWN